MVTVDEIYSDGMVIQRGKAVVIKGSTDRAEQISIHFLGQHARFGADGKWSVTLPAIPFYGGPYSMDIAGSANRIIIKNIYVGELWFAVGQSNMQFRLHEEAGYGERIEKHCSYNVHMFRPFPKGMPVYDYDGLGWISDTKDVIGKMSAAAYYFACQLAEKLNCPIGIIDCSMGSTSVACWMSPDAVSRCEPAGRVGKDEDNDYLPSALYQAMLEKVEFYKAAGVIYYQGESDIAYRGNYSHMLKMLISDWRDRADTNMPFIEVMLPGFAYHGNAKGTEWADIRREQIAVAHELPDVTLINTVNDGEMSEIHPKRKKSIGDKLAMAALETVYHEVTHFRAPEVISCEFAGNRAILHFSHATVLQERGKITEPVFEAAGEEGVFYEAEYEIMGTEIALFCAKIPVIRHVRVGYRNYCRINILNEYGVPLLPFMETFKNLG